MKQILYLLITLFIVSCSGEQKKLSVIGTRNGDLITVKPFEVKDTVDLNLSDLVEDIEIIRLETSSQAMIKPISVYITDNYLAFLNLNNVKLFDRKTGNFICNVGNEGRGPGEYYIGIYHIQIDERAGKIYMLGFLNIGMKWQIQVYDLMTGRWTGESIALASFSPKGKFNIDTQNNKLSIAITPFEGECDYAAWYQDFEGNMIHGIKSEQYKMTADYSQEIFSTQNTSNFDIHFFNIAFRADSLYHYKAEENKLIPVFNIDVGSEKVPHFYYELPTMFICRMYLPNNPKLVELFVNKSHLEGAYCRIINDFLGDGNNKILGDFVGNGYYLSNNEPLFLLEQLKPFRESATGKARERIDYILDNVKEDDNNVVIIGKLKQ